MNDWDRNNLNFLMSLKTQADWDEWLETVNEDDVLYALELIRTELSAVNVQMMELQEEAQDEVGLDCSEAMSFINRVKKESL